MKNLLNIFLIIFMVISSSNAQFIRKWEKSSALGNLPSWFSSNGDNVRGIALSFQNAGPRLLVITDKQTPTVIILDPQTGDSLGTLNTAGINGGLNALNDLTIIFNYYPFNNTKILGCNLTENASLSPFKIYMWQDIFSPPQVIIVDSISSFRLGDHLNAYNHLADKDHITTASSGNNKIVDYYSTTPTDSYIRQEITLSDGSLGSNASADYNLMLVSFDFGGFFINSDDNYPKVYNYQGVLDYTVPDSVISNQTNALRYYQNGTLCCDHLLFATFNYLMNKADLVQTFNHNLEYLTYWGATSSLGSNPNPTNYGDIDLYWSADDTLMVFVLAGNNGIGAYHAKGLMLPVEIVSFTAEQDQSGIFLKWITATELNNKGFEIERSSASEIEMWAVVGFVQGRGTTVQQTIYSFKDTEIDYGAYKYRLKQLDFDGSYEYSQIVEFTFGLPRKFVLMQNYPNPFNPTTSISYEIAEAGPVSLKVYDIIGSEVAVLANEVKQPGKYTVQFNVSGLPSGVYIYQLKTNSFISSKEMVIVK